jgi:hypothetical protein
MMQSTSIESQNAPQPISNNEEDAPSSSNPLQSLKDRIPSTERVVGELQTSTEIRDLLGYSNYWNTEERIKRLLTPSLWEAVHQKLSLALSTHSPLRESELNSKRKKYIAEKARIMDNVAPFLIGSLPSKEHEIEASIILQIISDKYFETFESMIAYSGSGDKLTIKEQVGQAIEYAHKVEASKLFSDPKILKNVYYIIGFLGRQAEKQSTKRKEGSGAQKCFKYISDTRWLVRNRSESQTQQINTLISNPTIPTDLVQQREAFGGLHYPDEKCWRVFAIVDYVYSKTATSENFLKCGGTVLSEVSEALIHNNTLRKLFAYDLCECSDNGAFSLDDTDICLHFFLRVFGRVRAKDIALKFNSQMYKGTNDVAHRSTIAVLTSKKQPEEKQQSEEKQQPEEDLNLTLREHHNEMLKELNEIDEEHDDDCDAEKYAHQEMPKMTTVIELSTCYSYKLVKIINRTFTYALIYVISSYEFK